MSKWTVCVNTPIHPTVLFLDGGNSRLVTGNTTMKCQNLGQDSSGGFQFDLERTDHGSYVKMFWQGVINGTGMVGKIVATGKDGRPLGTYDFVGCSDE